VYRRIGDRMRPLRLGRGCAPLELTLPWRQPAPVIAVGGHMKGALALSWEDRVVVSPHIGEMDSPRSLAVFEQVATDLQALYGVSAERIVCDAHSGYTTHQWARRQPLPVATVWHHEAHASAVAAEFARPGQWLMFAWDGVGLGSDGTLWGGEALRGRPGDWQRFASLRPFHLPGGERAGREPWRSAAALCWETGHSWADLPHDARLARHAWARRLNTPQTTAAGRLFDAAAALTGLCNVASFEGQGPMLLEALAEFDDARPVSLPLARSADGWVTDWEPLVDLMLDDQVSVACRSGRFHASLAAAVADQAEAIRKETGASRVALTGGVFQNRLLTELSLAALQARGMSVDLDDVLPVNDGGLSAGQIVEYAACQSVSAQT